jgi:hypothetical protein
MHILRVEHPVPNYDTWKAVFDNDPIDREGSGVRRYRIPRATDDPNYVMIDLEFDGAREAEAFHAVPRDLWERVDVMHNPQARIAEVVERTFAWPSHNRAGRAEHEAEVPQNSLRMEQPTAASAERLLHW